MMEREVVKVRADMVAQRLKCNLCQNFLDDATTIVECLHSFCRVCIVKKITEEGCNTCPVCKVELGAVPLDKLRSDYNLKQLREKLFPPKLIPKPNPETKTKKANNKEAEAHDESHSMYSSVPVTAKEKERSLSSLADTECKKNAAGSSKNRVQNMSTENNAKILKEKVAASDIKTDDQANTQEATVTNNPVLTDPPATVSKVQGKRFRGRGRGRGGSHSRGKDSAPTLSKTEAIVQLTSATVTEGQHSVPPVESKGSDFSTEGQHSVPVESKESEPATERQNSVRVESKGSEPAEIRFFSPIWFSLIASHDQKVYPPLPQLSSRFLRVKDDTLTVSLIKKYIVKKLNLSSESEVEILLKGEPMSSALQLRSLLDIYGQSMSSENIETSPGSSGEDVVMDLTYARKAQS
ncbi:hypothetical protein G4B88_003112 [Cannabis sativa]|uniref:RING-type domain-containing protein n=1 Tax=Cannabis sativa TaxID=3483 RepID=A0A7J6H4C5_CANSA|nr:hypothetical protein G4B88_003112 [Cannabis sativa]